MNVTSSSDLFISVINECGITVKTIVSQPYNVGMNQFVLDVSDILPGFYFVKISGEQFAIQKKFVVSEN